MSTATRCQVGHGSPGSSAKHIGCPYHLYPDAKLITLLALFLIASALPRSRESGLADIMRGHFCFIVVLLTPFLHPGCQQNPDTPVDLQIYRAGLLFQQTDYGLQIVEETVVVQMPFSLSPLREAVKFMEKFMASMCIRLDRLLVNFYEVYEQVLSFPGKDEVSSRFQEASETVIT